MANGWEWPNIPSLTHPHLKLEHYDTFHSLMLNGIFLKNRGGQFRLTILYLKKKDSKKKKMDTKNLADRWEQQCFFLDFNTRKVHFSVETPILT